MRRIAKITALIAVPIPIVTIWFGLQLTPPANYSEFDGALVPLAVFACTGVFAALVFGLVTTAVLSTSFLKRFAHGVAWELAFLLAAAFCAAAIYCGLQVMKSHHGVPL